MDSSSKSRIISIRALCIAIFVCGAILSTSTAANIVADDADVGSLAWASKALAANGTSTATTIPIGFIPKPLYDPSLNTWDGRTMRGNADEEEENERLDGKNNKGAILYPVPAGMSELKPYFQHSLVISNRTGGIFYIFWNITEDRKSLIMAMQLGRQGGNSTSLNKWFAFGFGGYDQAHMRSDIVFAVDNTVQDRFTDTRTLPYLDKVRQSLQGGSHTTYTFRGITWQTAIFARPLAPDDRHDRQIWLDKTTNCIWALGDGVDDKHSENNVGAVWINFATGQGRQYSDMVDQHLPNIYKGVFIFAYLIALFIFNKTVFRLRFLYRWKFEYFILHYFKYSIFDFLLLLTWVGATLGFTLLWWDPRKELGIIFAVGSEFPTALIFISAIRMPLWQFIYGVSYERQIRYHRWVAWTLFAMLALHSLYTFAEWIPRGSLFEEFRIKPIVWGAVSGGSLLLVFLASQGVVRRNFWEFFKWFHFTFIVFIIFGALHELRFLYFVAPGVVFWLIDRVRRLVHWIRGTKVVSLNLNNDVVEIKFKRAGFDYISGQFVFIMLPQVSRMQLHPFTISSSPRDEYVSVHTKALGNFTTAIQKLPDKKHVSIVVEGPYGHKPSWKEYNIVVMFGAGIGATPWISIVRDFLLDTTAKGPKHVYFFFSVTNKSNLAWFDDTWELDKQCQNTGLHIRKFVTREKAPAEGAEPGITYGRPNMKELIREIDETHNSTENRALVMSCGPGMFSRGVQDAAFKHSKLRKMIFEFHDEVFKF